MASAGDTMYMTSYPSQSSQHYSMNMDSGDPYYRYTSSSPPPSLSPSSSYHSLRRQRSSSLPSIGWAGVLEHHPVEPRRRRDSVNNHYYANPHRTQKGSRHHTKYSRNSLLVNPDIIDSLDDTGVFQYHHEGPYDAVYPERNRSVKHSPIEALKESNKEALKATPKEKIADCLNSHRPLDGVAFYPPGTSDEEGRTYEYEEGTNMMNEYGNFMRCPGMKFTEEDFKNDPFYNTPPPKPFASLRKVLSLRRRDRSGTT